MNEEISSILPLKSPLLPSGRGEEVAIGAAGDAIDAIVSAHYSAGSASLHAGFERRLVGVGHILLRHLQTSFDC